MDTLQVSTSAAAVKTASSFVVEINRPTPLRESRSTSPRTISELISQRAKEHADEPILGYPSTGTQYQLYTYAQLEQLSLHAAAHYRQSLRPRPSSSEPERVVALLGVSDINHLITTLALSRLGFTVLFLSTRISEVAYISLLEATKCSAVLVSSSFRRTAISLKSGLAELLIVDIPETLHSSTGSLSEAMIADQNLDPNIESKKISWIIHSSGSTGLPKPIYQTHQAALYNYANNMDMRGFITLPLFHAHGLSSVFRGLFSRKIIYMYSATLPMTQSTLLDIMHQNQNVFEIFYGVPYALKLLSESKEGVQSLARMKVVMFGGSACPDALGDYLAQNGVNLISHYGTTETGQLMTSARVVGDNAWNYVRTTQKLEPFVEFEKKDANSFELVVLEGWPSLVATNRPGAYATKDLFEPHTTISNAWKYVGRLDDTIVLVNGEKAVPNALEQAVRRHPLVREAMIFGTGRARLGLLVIAADDTPQDALVSAIWPIVEKESASMPGYAQITKDMTMILPAGTAYPQTDKGTAVRQGLYRVFQQEIDDLYIRMETKSSGSMVLASAEMKSFLRRELLALVSEDNGDLDDDTDLFSRGIDSLQSARLRSTLLQNLQFNRHAVPPNVVFENPTISKLADALICIREGKAIQSEDVVKRMEHLIKKYSIIPTRMSTPRLDTSSSKYVLVTGATGSLGAHVVAQLATRSDVSEIVCLVRATSNNVADLRVHESMRKRGLYDNLDSVAWGKVKCLRAELRFSKMGLSLDAYQQLRGKIDTVIHCAWSVNFNKSLDSLEDCIQGAHNLLKFSLSVRGPRPAAFNFCSSVSTVAATPDGIIPEALPANLAYAQNMGYAQSKLVTEHVVTRLAEAGMDAKVLRIGQISADTVHGIWNDTEAIPLMLQSAVSIGSLPLLDESPRWLPVDIVARSVIEISLSSTTPSETVYNLVNPHAFHWSKDLLPCLRSAGLSFDEVTPREWIKRLRASDKDPVQNPTYKLVEFFASKYDNDGSSRKGMNYTTTETESLAPILTTTPALSQQLVNKFVDHFRKTSWASTPR